MVWRVFMKLTSTDQARLVDRWNFTTATEVISSELYVQIVKLGCWRTPWMKGQAR